MARQTIVKLFGIIFVLGGIYIAVCGISNYKQQLEQRDWRVVAATVTEVKQYRKSCGGRKGHSKIVYEITYVYDFNDDSYTGEIIGTVNSKNTGDRFDVKCNQDSPEISTHILEPRADALIGNLLGACLFVAAGLWISGALK